MKLVVWDLDDTLWNGTFVYDKENVVLKPNIKEILNELDKRGFLQSIISRNPPEVLNILEKFSIKKFFIFPQVSWQSKNILMSKLLNKICILPKDVAFVDNDPRELELVKRQFPEIKTIDASIYKKILEMKEFQKKVQIRDKGRKIFFEQESERLKLKENFKDKNNFLNSLDIFLHIKIANKYEIEESLELINRSNQLNATGEIFDNVEKFLKTYKDYLIIVGYPEDRFGSYGLTLVAICKKNFDNIVIDNFVVSCRILDRELIPTFLQVLQEKWKNKNIFIKFKKTKYNEVLKKQLFECGFFESKETNYLEITKKIETKVKVRMKIEI